MKIQGHTLRKIGQHMMNHVSKNSASIKDDAYFNALCRHGESLALIGLPFYPTKPTTEELEFAKVYVKENM